MHLFLGSQNSCRNRRTSIDGESENQYRWRETALVLHKTYDFRNKHCLYVGQENESISQGYQSYSHISQEGITTEDQQLKSLVVETFWETS